MDYLFVPLGEDGLISVSAITEAYLSPNCIIIDVESEAGNDVQYFFSNENFFSIATSKTISDGVQIQFIVQLILPILIKS
ncbi:hypothetical protein B1F79_05405 [Coxiella-like endosymbiont of Rhipicephalus sanguineus]|uniref:hypothetical protein n=1 Tax=Coxiella-like endosymbiont of Rhipicephalus sanguineus TaxID=1955402 RepID=UPI00203C1B4D|nr:hypothetical protein [Coxiella-like endosymbiont of Rhipicephalus sanguineus]MBT8506815.1 hypothetical protein [Coxiella-like endosymbiont of Rhipicephalus sanguineus]